jgi:hypothetical protein
VHCACAAASFTDYERKLQRLRKFRVSRCSLRHDMTCCQKRAARTGRFKCYWKSASLLLSCPRNVIEFAGWFFFGSSYR